MSRAKATRLTYYMLPTLVMGLIGMASAETYRVMEVTDGGSIRGVASWKGDIPELPEIQATADLPVCGETQPSPALQVDPKTKGVRWVLVYLEQVEKGKAPSDKYWLHMGKDSTNKVRETLICQFKEHIFPFVRSQMVAMVNFEAILHNPHFFNEKNTSLLNVTMPTPYREVDHTILQFHGKGVMRYQCDVHAHMNGYWAGFPHPYFAVTDAEGRFEIAGIPPGTYTLVAWHEGYKTVREDVGRPIYDAPHVHRQEIEVKPKGTVDVRFEFPVRKVTIE
jgi:hypothetical protein